MKKYLELMVIILAVAISGAMVGFWIGRTYTKEKSVTKETEAIETFRDTITNQAPVPVDAQTLVSSMYILPIRGGGAGGKPRCTTGTSDTTGALDTTGIYHYGDSAIVELPTMQRHYADSTFEAWVSGPIDPRLDSVRVFPITTIIHRKERDPPKHWHIGVTAGYGYGPNGFEPYIGIGLTYSIISF